ncbi:MAG: type III pantothenate kinase [Planctomycetota bacterium]
MIEPLRLLADIGNTRVHFGLARGTQILGRVDLPGEVAGDSLRRVLEELVGGEELSSVTVASVQPARAAAIASAIDADFGMSAVLVQRYDQVPIRLDLERPETVGVDRLLNALAAWRTARGAHIILDFGSALTVDLVDAAGVFRGGAIAPGAPLLAQALRSGTALLPLVELGEEPPVLGRNTEQAIKAGVFHGLVGAARQLLLGILEHAADATVWATGGDAGRLAPHVAGIHRVAPELTLQGLAWVASGGGDRRESWGEAGPRDAGQAAR